jgi:hypothetical protein
MMTLLLRTLRWNSININLMLFLLVLMGCQPKSDHQAVEKNDSESTPHHEESSEIKLNNGEKWKVDDHMMVHLRNMETAVAALKNPSLSECKELSKQLQSHLDLLTSNCTMKGQAHDELHKWLLPFLDLVDTFSKVTSEPDANSSFNEIEKSFLVFNQYFQ